MEVMRGQDIMQEAVWWSRSRALKEMTAGTSGHFWRPCQKEKSFDRHEAAYKIKVPLC